MTRLVADTSALVSLGVAADGEPDPLALCLSTYDVLVPETVLEEVRDVAAYEDAHGRAAERVLERADELDQRSVTLDAEFPLDAGENAAVTLANEVDAAILLCDEFDSLGLVHASLADTRLATTPTFLSMLVRNDRLTSEDAAATLETIGAARSWEGNSYVKRARSLLDAE